ncbi:MAG: FG-GAP-like repeat-containing protein [Bacteroidia bacterium]
MLPIRWNWLSFIGLVIVAALIWTNLKNSSFTSPASNNGLVEVIKVSKTERKDAPLPALTQDNWQQKVQQDIALREYHINYAADKKYHQSPNRANNTRITYYPQSIQIAPRTLEEYEEVKPTEPNAERKLSKTFEDYTLQLEVKGYGITQKIVHPFQAQKLISENNEAFAKDGHMKVEYINNEQGTRQNFIINQPVKGNELAVHLNINTSLTATQENEGSIKFTGKQNSTQLYYNDLKVWDATGKTLPAQMKLSNEGQEYALILAVNTTGAEYPITIDPIVTNGTPANANQALEVNQANAAMGISVRSAGDVNGDGYSDVIVGAQFYDNVQSNEGAAFVYHGSATGLSSTASFMVESNQANAEMGNSVCSAGDVNGDGYSDVIVGAANYSNGQSSEGAAFVYHGSATGLSTAASFMVESNQASIYMGFSVSNAGDVNGDGYSDVIIGVIYYTNGQSSEGAAFIYHGSITGLTTSASAMVESNLANAYMGFSVSSAGDVNGDGYSDVIVGARSYNNGQTDEGAAFVYHGSAGGISTTASFMVESNQANAFMGNSLSSAGDVNGDGYSDVIVGAYGYSNGQLNEGVAFVYHGSASGLSTSVAAMVESNQANAHMGFSVNTAGDVNGDGYSDVIVGARQYTNGQSSEGAAFVYHGSTTGLSTTAAARLESNLATAYMGYSVNTAGDVNGDGFSDVIVGAYNYTNGQANEGAAFVYHGSASGLSTSSNVIAECNNDASSMGLSVSGAGDINEDGYNDIIVGAPGFDNGQAAEGAAFIYHGSATGISGTATTVLESNDVAAYFGQSVSGAGDVNGDGYSDVIIGAYLYDNNQSNEGAVYIYQGSASGIVSGSPLIIERNLANANLGCSVSAAGDVNGDGYSDVIAGADYYANGQSNEGAAFLYYGSSTGTTTTGAVMLELNIASSYFGDAVGCAGDVNGDGYSDVIVGAERFTNGQTEEGAFWVFHGGATGLNTTAAAKVESNLASAHLGISINSAGDVNGDGYGDIIAGAYAYSNGQLYEGLAYVHHGSSGGVNTSPATTLECNVASAYFGYSVSSAGDVNGDGYSDVLVGAFSYANGQTGEGAVFIYHGSSSGISSTVAMIAESNTSSWNMGRSVASAGDVNGDGYSDVLFGVSGYTNGQTSEGATFVYYGNGGSTGRRNNLRLYNTDLSTPIQQSNKTSSSFGLGLYTSSPEGRQKVKMVWEVKTQGQPFSSAGGKITNSVSNTSVQSSYSNTGLTGTNLNNLVSKPGQQTKVRCRVQYDLVTSITGQKYGPWRYPQGYLNGQQGMSSTPLPVEWLSFTAQWLQEGESAQLNWSTASEKNNSHFTLLRSIDGQNWEEVTQVNGVGTTNNISQYTYIDNSLKHLNTSTLTHLYYRLMQTDYNGQFSFSDIRELSVATESGISVSPNPGIHQVITLNQPAATDLPYIIIDIKGKEVGKGIIAKGSIQQAISLQHLPSGVYLVNLQQDGKVHAVKVVR